MARLIAGLAQPAAGAPCQKPIQTDFSKLITTNGRTYLVAGCLDIAPAAGFPVVLAFHGGGEDVHTDTDTGTHARALTRTQTDTHTHSHVNTRALARTPPQTRAPKGR